jgi:ssDNA thymidine ADP-ribosyltransferase DarT-like protein
MTVEEIRLEATRRGITRLCHFTPLRNLVHIATSSDGLLATAQLDVVERREFNAQDRDRLDGYPNHISCSIQYPNAYYVQTKRRDARGEERLFPRWVCLFVAPHHLWRPDTLLCPHNAAGRRGANVAGGVQTFVAMFAGEVLAPHATWIRRQHPECYPTDAQAEVLIHRQVPLLDIIGVAVEDSEQAADTYAVLRQLDAPIGEMTFIVAPDFYAPAQLAAQLARGRLPVESAWHPPKGVRSLADPRDHG